MTHPLCHSSKLSSIGMSYRLPSYRWRQGLCIFFMIITANISAAQDDQHAVESRDSTALTLAAEGHAQRIPDKAEITVAVVTRAPQRKEAMAANAVKMQRLLKSLQQLHISEKDVFTRSVSLSRDYSPKGSMIGYLANNTVRISLDSLPLVAQVIDILSEEDIAVMDGPDFKVSKAEPAYDEARLDALNQIRQHAAAYAASLGLTVKRIVRPNESRQDALVPTVLLSASRSASQHTPTPIAPGEITLNVNLEGTFELTRRARGAN